MSTLRKKGHVVTDTYNGSLVSEREIVPILAIVIVAKGGIPSKAEMLGLIHGNVHGVWNFHVRRKIVVAGHGDAERDREPERFVPEGNLVNHVFENVSAGIVPEEPPVDEALGIEIVRRGFTLECFPIDVVEIADGRDGPAPTAVGAVAVMVSVDGGDGAHTVGSGQGVGSLKSFATDGLDADLNDAIRLFKGTSHTPCVIGIKGHGLFLVDILAGLNGGNKVERMQVLGSSDEDGVDGFIVEQASKIGVGLNRGNNLLGFVEAAGVDVGDGDSLRVGGVDSLFENVQSPATSTDQGKADAVIGAEDARGCEKGIADQGGSTSCNTVDEISSIEHGCGS